MLWVPHRRARRAAAVRLEKSGGVGRPGHGHRLNGAGLRIAIFLESLPGTGGGFQQALSTIEALVNGRQTPHEFVVLTPYEATRRSLAEHGIAATRFRHRPFNLLDRWSATVVGNAV